MNVWIEGARPKTLIASFSPVLIGTVLAFKEGVFHPFIFLLTLLFAVFIQIGTNLANDYFDFLKGADTEKRKGPRRLCQSGLLSPEKVKRGALIAFITAALCALYLTFQGGWVMAVCAIFSITLGYLYTAGPYPLGYIGLADLFVLLFFGPIATAGTVYLQTHHFSPDAALAGLAPGLISTAILTSNNLRDFEEDRKAGKRTLPVRFGLKVGKSEYVLCLALAALLPFYFPQTSTGKLLTSINLGLALPLMIQAIQGKEVATLLPKTGKWMMLYTFAFLIGWLL